MPKTTDQPQRSQIKAQNECLNIRLHNNVRYFAFFYEFICKCQKKIVPLHDKIIHHMPVPRKIQFYKQYFLSFYINQTEEVRRKINQVLKLVETQEKIPRKFFRPIETSDGLFEIRVEMASNIYRIFCCFDKGNLVILFNGFQKKSQKTPPDQITRAERIKQEYFNEKETQR